MRRILLYSIGTLVLISSTLFFTRKFWVARLLDQVSERLIGMETQTEILELSANKGRFSVRLVPLKLKLSNIEARWTLWDLLWGNLELHSHNTIETVEGSEVELKNASLRFFGKIVGREPERVLLQLMADEVQRGVLSGKSLQARAEIDDEKSTLEGNFNLPEGRAEIRFEGTPLFLGHETKGKFSIVTPFASSESPLEFKTHAKGFVVHFEGLELRRGDQKHDLVPKMFAKETRMKVRLERNEDYTLQMSFPLPILGPCDLHLKMKNEAGTWKGEGEIKIAQTPTDTKVPQLGGAIAKFEIGETIQVEAQARDLRAGESSGPTLAIGSVQVTATGKPGDWKGRVLINAIGDRSAIPLWMDVSSRTEFSLSNNRFEFNGVLVDMIEAPWMNWKGELDTKSLNGFVKLDRKFNLQGDFDPSTLTEHIKEFISRSGTLDVAANLVLRKGKIVKESAHLEVKDANFDYQGVPIRGVNGRLALAGLFPPKMLAPETWRFESVGTQLPARQGQMTFELLPQAKLRVSKLNARFGGGYFEAEPFLVDLGNKTFKALVKIRELRAESILEGLQLTKVQARGTVNGNLPLVYKNDFLHVQNGHLANQNADGWIHYEDETTALTVENQVEYLDQFQRLLSMGQQALIFKALDNFFFKKLAIDVNRSPEKGLEAKFHMAGYNPDLAKGQPFEFNIALSGQVENAVKQSLLKGFMEPEAFGNVSQ